MAGNIATAYVQIIPTTEGIASGISESLGGEGAKGGKKFASRFLSGAGKFLKIGGVAAAAGFIALTKSAMEAGGAIQQSFGGLVPSTATPPRARKHMRVRRHPPASR